MGRTIILIREYDEQMQGRIYSPRTSFIALADSLNCREVIFSKRLPVFRKGKNDPTSQLGFYTNFAAQERDQVGTDGVNN